MTKGIALLLLAACAAQPAAAQRRPPQREPDDYGELMRRATMATEPLGPADVERSAPVEAPRPIPATPSRSADLDGGDEASVRSTLHSPSEYADEPHHVGIVDRSRYAPAFRPATVPNTIGLEAGAILVDTRARQLYFGLGDGTMRRYGVAVGKTGAAWRGTATVGRMARWPDWRPTANIRRENRRLPRVVKGSGSNPLGARAIYLYQGDRDTMYRVHGTNAPSSIGKFASHGCIRMINEDVIELYSMVRRGAVVHVR